MVRALATTALVLALGGIGIPAAAGHASQTGSTPAAGAVLTVPPSSVEVAFDTPLMDVGAALVVRSEDGTVTSDPVPEVAGTRLLVGVRADAPPGRYTVAFRVVSQDGHPITSTFDYTVAGDAPEAAPSPPTVSPPAGTATADAPADAPAAAASEAASGPPYALIAGGLLALTLLVAGAIALRR